jgi:hypothetical protein
VPRYLALFKGKNTFHPGYNGKFAYFNLLLGKNAYRELDFDLTDSYVLGFAEFQPKVPIKWDEKREH